MNKTRARNAAIAYDYVRHHLYVVQTPYKTHFHCENMCIRFVVDEIVQCDVCQGIDCQPHTHTHTQSP